MEGARVAPDSTSTPSPVHTRNAIVIARDETQDVVAYHGVLVGRHIVDAADVETDASKQRFPSSDGVSAYDWMGGRELVVHVERRTTWGHNIVATTLTGRLEDGLRACRCQCLEKALERR